MPRTKKPAWAGTREDLEKLGVRDIIIYDDYIVVMHEGYLDCKTKRKTVVRPVRSHTVTAVHKYTRNKTYPVINWSVNNKLFSVTVGRLVYAWFKGEVKADMDIDHIDNNPFNNKPENLQQITRLENIRKRYTDNPEMQFNQYKNSVKDNKGE